MSITYLNRDTEFGEEIDFLPLLKNGSIHYVSVAMPGMPVASSNIQFAGGFSIEQRNQFMMRINRAQETSTLYPEINITLLPSPSASYLGMDNTVYHEGDYSEQEVAVHILDAFKANSEYIKSDKMYFDFRNLCVSEDLYVSCLRSVYFFAIDKKGYTLEGEKPEVITWHPH